DVAEVQRIEDVVEVEPRRQVQRVGGDDEAALGILGGLIVATFTLNLTPGLYLNDVFDSLNFGDVGSGIAKSFFIAYFIAVVGCYNGLNTTGGADGVGRATTNTLVAAAILVLSSG